MKQEVPIGDVTAPPALPCPALSEGNGTKPWVLSRGVLMAPCSDLAGLLQVWFGSGDGIVLQGRGCASTSVLPETCRERVRLSVFM